MSDRKLDWTVEYFGGGSVFAVTRDGNVITYYVDGKVVDTPMPEHASMIPSKLSENPRWERHELPPITHTIFAFPILPPINRGS